MNKKKTTTAVAIKDQVEMQLATVPEKLAQIKAALADIEDNTKNASALSGSLKPFGKLADMTDPMQIREAYTYITSKTEANTKNDPMFAKITIGKLKPYSEGGFSLKQWQEAILVQYTKVTKKDKIAKLKEAKKELEKLLSDELQVLSVFDNVADLLS